MKLHLQRTILGFLLMTILVAIVFNIFVLLIIAYQNLQTLGIIVVQAGIVLILIGGVLSLSAVAYDWGTDFIRWVKKNQYRKEIGNNGKNR